MKINLLDPGLADRRGHHYDWNRRIVKQLVAAGHEVSVYAHAEVEREALLGFDGAVRAQPLFTLNPYVPASSFDPICGDIQRQIVGTRLAARNLEKVAPADLWLWPTAFAHQLRACAFVGADADISACLHIPPGNELPFAESGPWWRLAALALREAGRRIRAIGTTEAEGVSAFLPFIDVLDPVHLPVAIDGTPVRRSGFDVVGFFAQSREEQGGRLAGELIARCLQSGFKVATQTDEMVPPMLRNHPGLMFLGYEGDFPSKVERCDLLVIPYRSDTYGGGRGSSLMWQARASGIPCVVPQGATSGLALERQGSASLFSEHSVACIFDAILHARKVYPALAEAAFRGGKEWRERNGIAQFVDVMINGARKARGPSLAGPLMAKTPV